MRSLMRRNDDQDIGHHQAGQSGNEDNPNNARYRELGLPVPVRQASQSSEVALQQHQTPMATGMATQLPNGQNINVVTNHNIHLDRKEWLFRGVVGSIGDLLAFPFRLVGSMLNGIGAAIVMILKIAALIMLIPTLIYAGIQLQALVSQEDSAEAGTEVIMDQAGGAAKGIGNSLWGNDTPSE